MLLLSELVVCVHLGTDENYGTFSRLTAILSVPAHIFHPSVVLCLLTEAAITAQGATLMHAVDKAAHDFLPSHCLSSLFMCTFVIDDVLLSGLLSKLSFVFTSLLPIISQ